MNENNYNFEIGRREPCRKCGAMIRVCYAGAARTPWVVDSRTDNKVVTRFYGHCCPALGIEQAAKLDVNMLIGKADACNHCGKPIRVVYLVRKEQFWIVDSPLDPANSERLWSHRCPEYYEALARGEA